MNASSLCIQFKAHAVLIKIMHYYFMHMKYSMSNNLVCLSVFSFICVSNDQSSKKVTAMHYLRAKHMMTKTVIALVGSVPGP